MSRSLAHLLSPAALRRPEFMSSYRLASEAPAELVLRIQMISLFAGSTAQPQKTAPPQKHYSHNSPFDYTQDGHPHRPYMQPAWQTHPRTQTSRFPIGAPHQPQGSSHVPPSSLPPPVFGHHHPWPRQTPPQPDWSWTTAIPPGSEALWGQLFTEEPPPEREAVETSRAPSSRGERGGGSGSSLLSQELDVKPGGGRVNMSVCWLSFISLSGSFPSHVVISACLCQFGCPAALQRAATAAGSPVGPAERGGRREEDHGVPPLTEKDAALRSKSQSGRRTLKWNSFLRQVIFFSFKHCKWDWLKSKVGNVSGDSIDLHCAKRCK